MRVLNVSRLRVLIVLSPSTPLPNPESQSHGGSAPMTASSPAVPSSFDPAIHLHSEGIEPPSESFSDELEALHHQRLEKTRNKVVIQHRAWNLSDVFRSDEDITPGMSTCPW
jgi:hypothetical protein